MDLGSFLAFLLTAKQASMAALQHQHLLKRSNYQAYAGLKGDSTLGQKQLPLSRPEGHHLWPYIDRGHSIRAPSCPRRLPGVSTRLLPVSCNLICSLVFVSLICALLHASRSSPAATEYLRPNPAMNQQLPILPMQEEEEWWQEGRPLHSASGAVPG